MDCGESVKGRSGEDSITNEEGNGGRRQEEESLHQSNHSEYTDEGEESRDEGVPAPPDEELGDGSTTTSHNRE